MGNNVYNLFSRRALACVQREKHSTDGDINLQETVMIVLSLGRHFQLH